MTTPKPANPLDAVVEALKPFAKFADALNEEVPDAIAIGIYADGAMRFGPSGGADLGSLRAARAALSALLQSGDYVLVPRADRDDLNVDPVLTRAATEAAMRLARCLDVSDPIYRKEIYRAILSVAVEFTLARCSLAAPSSPAPKEDGWREMESAPRDGTRILGYCADDETIWFASWHGECWAGVDSSGRKRATYIVQLTHWRPLPSAPTADVKAEADE